MSRERLSSVKERRCYFENLGGCGPISHQSSAAALFKPRPYSEVTLTASSLSKIPPQKPKRTFEHNIYLESKLKTTFGSLSANTRIAVSRPPIMPKVRE